MDDFVQQGLQMMLMAESDDANDDIALLWRCHPVLPQLAPPGALALYMGAVTVWEVFAQIHH